MPSIAPENHTMPPACKKRRREGDDDGKQNTLHAQARLGIDVNQPQPDYANHNRVPVAMSEAINRKIFAFKRQRHLENDMEHHPYLQPNLIGGNVESSPHTRKHQRLPLQTVVPARQQPSKIVTGGLLDPCHVCRRKPTKKTDLDAFANCEGCGRRTCFVCLRQCAGWLTDQSARHHGDDTMSSCSEREEEVDMEEQEALSRSFHMEDADRPSEGHENKNRRPRVLAYTPGQDLKSSWTTGEHRRVVCSQCCIEKGSVGDIVCLGCLAHMTEA